MKLLRLASFLVFAFPLACREDAPPSAPPTGAAAGAAAATAPVDAGEVQLVGRVETPENPVPGDVVRVKEFHENGQLATERTELLKPDGTRVRQGPMKAFHLNGRLFIEGGYDDEGRKAGHWKYWDDQGGLVREGDFADDMREGDWIENHPNGARRYQGFIHAGLNEGPWKYWHDNGQLFAEGNYENNLREGTWLFYFPDGAPDATQSGRYVRGQRVQ